MFILAPSTVWAGGGGVVSLPSPPHSVKGPESPCTPGGPCRMPQQPPCKSQGGGENVPEGLP